MKWMTQFCLFSFALLASSGAMAKINIFACEPEWAALSKQLGGEQVKVYSATHARQDPHHIQARPSLIARLRKADLAVCTGAELEVGWMPMLQRRARNPKVLNGKPGYFEATKHVNLLEVPAQLDRADGDIHADGNPHIQLDPRRIHEVAKALAQRLQFIDPENSETYQTNWLAFDERWQKAVSQLTSKHEAMVSTTLKVGEQVLRATISPMGSENNKEGSVTILYDITAEAESQQARDEFVASLSQEIRTPMTSITGYTDLLLGESVGAMFGAGEHQHLTPVIRTDLM